MKKWLFVIFMLIPTIAYCNPTISTVKGTIADGQQINVTGGDFGDNGPNVLLFDDFSNGTDGDQASTSSELGHWSAMKGFTYSDNKLSNGKGLRVVDDSFSSGWAVNRIEFGNVYSEVYVSSRAYVPSGYRFPTASALKKMPSISALKHHWVYYGEKGYGIIDEPDIFGPNWTGANFYSVASNDSPLSTYDTSKDVQWVWDEPVRWSLWMKGNGTSISGSDGLFQAVSSSGQTNNRYKNYKAWFNPDHDLYGWDRMTVVGYLRSGATYPRDNYVIDDVYVAVGPNAAARVEIGNNSVYTACTKMAICTPTSWNSTKIAFTLREGTFKSGETAYLFVVKADNTPSSGFKVTMGGAPISTSGTDTDTVDAPENLKVVNSAQ